MTLSFCTSPQVTEIKEHSFDSQGEAQCNDMILINSLINSSDVLEERIQLRTKLNRHGFEAAFEELNLMVEDKEEYKLLQV